MTHEELDILWKKIACAIFDIAGKDQCTIQEISNFMENEVLNKDDWRIGNWRSLAYGAAQRRYIVINSDSKPYKYSLDKEFLNYLERTQEPMTRDLASFITRAKVCCEKRKVDYPAGTKGCYCLPCHIASAYTTFKKNVKMLNTDKRVW